ncbi:MAG: GTP-binding protein [Anaerolineales bacterium]|nr:GTP-binding protein [Anaerolineales bacterium]
MAIIQKKICLLGEFAVGKTSLIRRYVEDKFSDKYLSSIGVKVSRKNVELGDNTVKLLIWDLAGGEDYTQSSYLMGAAGALLVCDVTRADTLTAVVAYEQQLKAINPSATFVLVANKMDLLNDPQLANDALHNVLPATIPLYYTSAKTGQNVEQAFLALAQQLRNA